MLYRIAMDFIATHQFPVEPDDSGQRIDRFLATRPELVAAELSRSRLKVLIEEGHVRVGEMAVRDASAKVHGGAMVAIAVPVPRAAEPEGEAIALDVVFEDDHIIVIDKPAGLVVHPAAGHETGTLVNALIAHCGASLSGIGGVKRPGIVHRLDKDTSGLLVVAKNDRAHARLSRLFADHGRTLGLLREYRAIVWGAPPHPLGVVDAPVGRHPIHREKMAVVRLVNGREAITHWEILESWNSEATAAPVASLIACRLETGRTHQIRVHMAHIGHPVMGDFVYARGFVTKASQLQPAAQNALIALRRQALHAAVLGFPHPATAEEMLFESALPADIAALRDALGATG